MHQALIVAKLITMGLGFLIAYQAYRGYRVHGATPLKFVSIGFFFISLGSVIEGLLFDVVGWEIYMAGAIQTSIVALGMSVILYSLYGEFGERSLGGNAK